MSAPFDPEARRLTDLTIAAMRKTFGGYGHFPSEPQWTALGEAVRTMEDMACGTCQRAAYLSAIDPGVGKTQAVIHFLRELCCSPDHSETGTLVCIGRIEQILAIADAAKLSPADYAAFTRDATANALGRGHDQRHQARILFVTHAMLERRLDECGSFDKARDLHFRGRPRAVRIWDEALLPGRPLTLSVWLINRLYIPMARVSRNLTNDLVGLADEMRHAEDGSRFEVPDLGAKHGVSLADVLPAMRGDTDDDAAVRSLWHLFGRTATVRRDGGANAVLDYTEALPGDLWPVLVLDASGRVRTLYKLWEERRGGLVRLAEATKSYDGHTVHVWGKAGSKDAWRKQEGAAKLLDGIARTIKNKPDEKWLIVAHKADSIRRNIERELSGLLPSNVRSQVNFITYGKHDATNEFADVPNVILAGTLFFPRSLIEARGRGAAARPSSAGAFHATDFNSVELGESRHNILQAMCRGAVRKCINGGCPPNTHTYIIASKKSGVADSVGDILPGGVVVDWLPHSTADTFKGKEAQILAAIGFANADLREITNRTGIKPGIIKPILSRLHKRGHISRPARGVYRRATAQVESCK